MKVVSDLRDIYFAGGCFWGVEEYFSRVPGVYDVTVGYANGAKDNPTYKEVCSGKTGHAEAVHIRYDPKTVSLKTLAEQFFKIIDPVSVNRQGNDIGSQYRTGMYYVNDEDRLILASVMSEAQKKYDRPLAVELTPLQKYYLAEEYHQDYLKKNPGGYCHINFDSLKKIAKIIAITTASLVLGGFCMAANMTSFGQSAQAAVGGKIHEAKIGLPDKYMNNTDRGLCTRQGCENRFCGTCCGKRNESPPQPFFRHQWRPVLHCRGYLRQILY